MPPQGGPGGAVQASAAAGAGGPAADEGVSPVIGTILVLAITVIGIALLMVWGGPTIDRLQSQNAAFAMQAEFEGLRDASQDLSVPDHSRFPSIALPRGTLGLSAGTRFLVAADHDAGNATCDLSVTGWGGTAPAASVTVAAPGCSTVAAATFQVFAVSGGTLVRQAVALGGSGPYTATVAGADFTQGDWLFRITDGAANPVVYAQAWLHSGDRLTWELQSSTGRRALYLDGGAIFSRQGGATFLVKAPSIGDAAFGSGYYGVWLRTLSGTGLSALDQAGTHQVYLSLANNDLHVDNNTAYRVRYTFSGDLAEAWCKTLLDRNDALAAYAAYDDDDAMACPTGDGQGLRSVTFAYKGNAPFQLRVLHARIFTSLVQ